MLNLIPIERNGRAPRAARLAASPEVMLLVEQACEATAEMYDQWGFSAPWLGYLAERNGQIVGACGFKSPPRHGRVEISYFTFPEYEGGKVDNAMAVLLMMIAAAKDPSLTVSVQTLPEARASAEMFKQLGFHYHGPKETLEDGRVLEWRRPPIDPAPIALFVRACG